MCDYILTSRKELGKMPANPAVIRSIVTSTFADKICAHHGVHLAECLTGFKWIAAVMAEFEKTGSHNYVFGFEESYGYNIETDVRDKDGVSAAALCAEMTLYWRSKGKSLLQRLEELFLQFGYFEDRAISKNFAGAAGVATMKGIMTKLREEGLTTLGGQKVVSIRDIQTSTCYDPANPADKKPVDLPKSNVLQFFLENGTVVSARPSGTEPKIKFYINSMVPPAASLEEAKNASAKSCDAIEEQINGILDAAQ